MMISVAFSHVIYLISHINCGQNKINWLLWVIEGQTEVLY